MAADEQKEQFAWLLFGGLTFGAWDWRDPAYGQFVEGFWADIERVRQETGPFDVVFFAGDLVYRGKPEEYLVCSDFLRELFERLRGFGSQPVMLCVPGNHDSDRRLGVSSLESFEEFKKWAHTFRLPKANPGEWPGDFAVALPDSFVDVVGLNTALNREWSTAKWARLISTDPVLDWDRVERLWGGSFDRWANYQRVRLLLTHHPLWKLADEDDKFARAASRGFQLHLCNQADAEFARPRATGDSAIVIQAPRFGPNMDELMRGERGYVAGIMDLKTRPELSIWHRIFREAKGTWESAHQLHERIRLPLPRRQIRLSPSAPVYAESLRLKGFRCFDELELPLRQPSRLPGEWTCLAGINGAGKSSALQALCLVLLGDPLIRELGGERLNRMRRIIDGGRQRAEIEAVLQSVEGKINLRLEIDRDGHIEAQSNPVGFWQQLRSVVIASYGATRNLSARIESGYENLSADVRRQITLFDPLSQLASAEVLLRERAAEGPLLPLFQNVVQQLFEGELRVQSNGRGMRFVVADKDHVEAMDLPDGVRACAAWLADLCSIWCDKAPELAKNGNPADIQAIVAIDDIDLHLHPSLQRKLVPKLREAMPKVQWIVTTHSPLVLANFDANEIIALDRDREGNVRPLDRQILGWSSNQIYEWLMGTPPTGEAIEQKIEANEIEGEPKDDELAALLTTSPTVNDSEAREKVQRFRSTIERLKP